MSKWQDFLAQPAADKTKPAPVMICFVNRYLEGIDGIRYKIRFNGIERTGTTTTDSYCVELAPKSLKPIETYVWSRKAGKFKRLDDVLPEVGRKKLVRKVLKTFKVQAQTRELPKAAPRPRPSLPAAAPAPAPSPTADQGVRPKQQTNESAQPQVKVDRPVPGQITVSQLRKIFPINKGVPTDAHLQAIADELNTDLVKFRLDTPTRRAHFFGQIKRESPDLSGAAESLSYTPQGLKIFSYYAKKPDEAQADGRLEVKGPDGKKKVTRAANQEVIANKVYGGREDLGNDQPGYGWKYRGRGMKQLTGFNNYNTFNKKYSAYWAQTENFVSNPDLVAHFPFVLRSALYFWVDNGCWRAADGGVGDAAIDAVTKIVNSGEIANHNKGRYKQHEDPVLLRRAYVKMAYAAFT
jgi:predicted chitinase